MAKPVKKKKISHALRIQVSEAKELFRSLGWEGTWVRGPQHPRWEPVSNAGIVLSGNISQLMLIRYGGPDLQMDFVSFVHLMLRVENMEGELAGREWIAPLSSVPADAGQAPGNPGCIYGT